MNHKQLIVLLCYQFGKILIDLYENSEKTKSNNLTLTDKILAITFCFQSFIKYVDSCPGSYWLWHRMYLGYFGEKKVSYYDDKWANKMNGNGIDRAVRYLTHHWLVFECQQRLNKFANNKDDEKKNEQELLLEKEQIAAARLGNIYLYFGKVVLLPFVTSLEKRFIAEDKAAIKAVENAYRQQAIREQAIHQLRQQSKRKTGNKRRKHKSKSAK